MKKAVLRGGFFRFFIVSLRRITIMQACLGLINHFLYGRKERTDATAGECVP